MANCFGRSCQWLHNRRNTSEGQNGIRAVSRSASVVVVVIIIVVVIASSSSSFPAAQDLLRDEYTRGQTPRGLQRDALRFRPPVSLRVEEEDPVAPALPTQLVGAAKEVRSPIEV